MNNGEVTAMGNGGGAGIGGALFGNGGTVNINGGFVKAGGGDGKYLGAAGIGSGGAYEVPETHPDYGKGKGGTVNINGGTVVAEGGKSGVGIGGSLKGANVTITGGKVSVTATGGWYSDNTKRVAGIGVGPQGKDPGTLKLIPSERGLVVNAGAGAAASSAVEGSPFTAETEIISLVKDKPYFNCRQGQFTVTGGQEGRDYIFVDDVLSIKNGGTYTVGMVGNIPVTSDRIEVNASEAVKLIIDNININCSSGTDIAAVEINGPEKVTLELKGKNSLNSGAGCAGVELKNNANLVITSSSGGQLDTCSDDGAGIGGINNTEGAGSERSVNKVVIKGGELTAIGKSCAIGAGAYLGAGMGEAKTSGTITISPAGAGINAWAGSSETENKALEGSTFFSSADITDLIKDKKYFYSREYVPYVPPAEDDVKTTPDGTTSTTVKETRTETVKNEQGEEISKVTATVSEKVAEKLVDQAVSNKSDTVEITVKSNDGNKAEQTEVEIPKKALESIAKETNASLVVKTDSGQVTLDNRTLETIAAEAEGETVKIIVNENTQLKEEQKPASDVIGKNGKLFNLKAVIGDKILHDFRGGKAQVILPIPEKLKGKDIVIIYINDKGICEILNHTMETVGAEKYIKFTTSHFSNFAVVEKADAEKLIAKQNADKINSLTKEAKLKATTSKTAKKSIKVKIGEAKNSNSLIKEAKAMGYTVKYKFYKSTKKASKYKAVKTKTSNSYINTKGKKGTKYYYKAKVLVYDGKNLIAQTELKQCSYGARTWSK
ncbi:MAG: carbohydrate-binding domain-containing protein [Clostridiales bacterium]|nr:carbohydrate-binding domain-containing protein [Clostridiales bacterium]